MYHLESSYCAEAANILQEKSATLTNISYPAMRQLLFSKRVITKDEMEILDNMTSSGQVPELVKIIISSLNLKNTKKYKGFLESMEQSEDIALHHMAEVLGEYQYPNIISMC